MTAKHFAGAIAAAVLLGIGTSPFAASARLTSAPAAPKMTIDGEVDEWPQLEPIEETHMSAAAQNDGRNLYLMIATSDQARRRQLMTAGLAIWLDGEGGKKQHFGIRIPGMMPSFGGPGQRGGGSRRDLPPSDPAAARALPPITYIEVLGPGKDDRRRIDLSAAQTIKAARGEAAGTVTLELQVPLQKNDANEFAIGARPGGVVGLGLETPKIERPESGPPQAHGGGAGGGGGRGGHGGMGGMGGMGGGRGGGGRGGGGGGPESHMERADPLKYWTTVQLAAASTTH